ACRCRDLRRQPVCSLRCPVRAHRATSGPPGAAGRGPRPAPGMRWHRSDDAARSAAPAVRPPLRVGRRRRRGGRGARGRRAFLRAPVRVAQVCHVCAAVYRSSMDWTKIRLTEHMTEAAAVTATCQVVLDFGAGERAAYEVKVLRTLKGAGEPFFALATNLED